MKPDLSSSAESATCTICGLKCDDRTAFNAHIRAHLKDKLTNRRKLQEQQQMASNNLEAKKAKKTAATAAAAPTVTTTTSKPTTTAKEVKDIQSLLPSSPLPLTTTAAPITPHKPDLESLLNQFQTSKLNKDHNPMVMAELAACKPIPPPPPPSTRRTTVTAAAAPSTLLCKPAHASSSIAVTPCTPEISDMEDDLMSYEMEMNRIDFHNDLASILDQIEKDFESPNLDISLDTPPDSDCENHERMLQPPPGNATTALPSFPVVVETPAKVTNSDLMGFDRFSQRIDNSDMLKLPSDESKNMRLIQSPASVAKVGKLPAKTLAVLNKLPSKLFLPEDTASATGGSGIRGQSASLPAPSSPWSLGQSSKEHRFVDVVKVESQAGNLANSGSSISSLLTAGTQCIINIECRQRDEPAKIIQTFRAIDTGSEIKLVPADLPIKVAKKSSEPPPMPEGKKSTSTSHCTICNKCITNKNMARHLEKHSKKEATAATFACKICAKTFGQRSHLSRHVKTVHDESHQSANLTCKVCGKVCKNRLTLVRHRSKHLSCVHCSTLFDSKVSLQDHLVKAHPEKAIVSLVQPPELAAVPHHPPMPTKLDFDSDDLGSMASSYSFSPTPSVPASLPPPDPEVGETLADIADSNYFFCGNSDITDDLYSTDLFATAQTC